MTETAGGGGDGSMSVSISISIETRVSLTVCGDGRIVIIVGPGLSSLEISLHVLPKWPKQIMTQTEHHPSISTSSKGYQIEDDCNHKTDQG